MQNSITDHQVAMDQYRVQKSLCIFETELLTNHDSPLSTKTPDTNKIAEIAKTLTNDRRNWTKFHLKCIGSNAN